MSANVRRSTRLVMSETTVVETATLSTPLTKRKRQTKKELEDENAESDLSPLEDEPPKTPKRRKSKKDDNEAEFSPKKRKKGVKKGSEATENATDDLASPKAKKKRAPKPEPVYIIPDVEKKQSTFKGRLGYACLNTILRNKKPKEEAIFCSRTCRIDTIKKNGIEWVKDLGRKNAEDLAKLIEWNVENNIHFMRISSELFPFASHPIYGYSLSFCSDLLASVGALAKKHNHRLTTHPGQYCQLGSPKPNVVESSIKELEYHAEMMELLGLDQDGVMILHGGGMYDDKEATIERIKHTIRNVLKPNVRARLVLENDELCYSAEDLLPICEELDVPLVFDYHHDALNPSSIPPKTIIERANAIFARRGIKPKQHLSEPRPGAVTLMERRAHADRCEELPPNLPDDMDLMIEAKDKEQAVLHLYRMYDLKPVIHASLRPPAKNQTKETKGRKSAKKKARPDTAEDEEAGEDDGGEGTEEAITVTQVGQDGKELVAEEEEP